MVAFRYNEGFKSCIQISKTTVPFAVVSPAAQRLAMATADSPGPNQQIEGNTLDEWRSTIE